jgi:hypothetical protein
MMYIQVKWIHSLNSEPVVLYSEIDENGWEIRKVEVYADGRMGFASSSESRCGAGLSKEPLPSIVEIAADPQFQPIEINQIDFERVWAKAHG